MPTAVEHSIIAILKPLLRGPDLSLTNTGMQLPDALDVQHDHTSAAASMNFSMSDGTLHFDMELLVPAAPPTDFILG